MSKTGCIPRARQVQNFPKDGGFGQLPANPDGTFGNRNFNTPSVVEAADTAPFFHNNVEGVLPNNVIDITQSLENAVRFYIGTGIQQSTTDREIRLQ